MNHPESFRVVIFLAVLVVMCLAEARWSKRRWEDKRLRRWLFHGGVSLFNMLLTRLLFAAPILGWILFLQERHWGFSHLIGLSGFSEIIVTFIIFDGFDYGWHRLNHAVPFFWRFHRAHHLDTHVDVTTALRFHPGELALSYAMKAVWVFVWGPSLLGFLIFETGVTAYSQFHHSNIDFPDPVEKALRLIHMTPRVHASHHTVASRTRDANYSTIFLMWDRIFGTFREPDPAEMKQLGLSEGRTTALSAAAFLKAPFVKREMTPRW